MSDALPRIIYMGTPEFAVEPLKQLLDHNFNIVAVVTAPDRPSGRGKKIQASAVKSFALSRGINDVLQPEKLKDPGFIEKLKLLKPDLQVVVAFRMLPREVWSLPRLGTFNLHASLLPQYRGAAPINHAIMNGETHTGVTTFFIDDQIDTGKILFRQEVSIPPDWNAGNLHDELMRVGAQLVIRTVTSVLEGKVQETPQSEFVTDNTTLHTAPKIFKENCKINWNTNGKKIYDLIRGLSPYPGAFTSYMNEENEPVILKILQSEFISSENSGIPGTLTIRDKKNLLVSTPGGYISVLSLQPEGRNRMDTADFLNGFKVPIEKIRFI